MEYPGFDPGALTLRTLKSNKLYYLMTNQRYIFVLNVEI